MGAEKGIDLSNELCRRGRKRLNMLGRLFGAPVVQRLGRRDLVKFSKALAVPFGQVLGCQSPKVCVVNVPCRPGRCGRCVGLVILAAGTFLP